MRISREKPQLGDERTREGFLWIPRWFVKIEKKNRVVKTNGKFHISDETVDVETIHIRWLEKARWRERCTSETLRGTPPNSIRAWFKRYEWTIQEFLSRKPKASFFVWLSALRQTPGKWRL